LTIRETKTEILNALRQHLRHELDAAIHSQKETQAGATHEESRPENDKDTRALESTYLARGLATRVAQLTESMARIVALATTVEATPQRGQSGAIITLVDEDENVRRYFLAPAGGGLRVNTSSGMVDVISVSSPLGQALVDRECCEEIELDGPAGRKFFEITAVQ
jgi:transcription elongation GreA/GreB family factor